jgi:hypothetical protein
MRQYGILPPWLAPLNTPEVVSATGLGTGGGAAIVTPDSGGFGTIRVYPGVGASAAGNVIITFPNTPPSLFISGDDAFGPLTQTVSGNNITIAWTTAALKANGKHATISYEWLITSHTGPIPNLPAYYTNFTYENTAKFSGMKAAVLNGTKRGLILGGIDSFWRGYGSNATQNLANGGDGWLNSQAGSQSARIPVLLNALATPIPASSDVLAMNGVSQTLATFAESDARFTYDTVGSGISLQTAPTMPGSTVNVLSWCEFAPAAAFDTIDIIYNTDTANCSFAVSVNHGSSNLVTVNAKAATKTVLKTTITAPAGSTSVRITNVLGTPGIQMIMTRVNATPKIQFINAGSFGRQIGSVNVLPSANNNQWNWLQTLPNIFDGSANVCCILPGGFNDFTNGGQAYAIANQTTMVQNLQSMGNYPGIMYVTYGNLSPPTGWAACQAALISNAVALGLPVVDITQLMGTYQVENALGHWFDTLHMMPYLQNVAATAIANAFTYF